MKKAMNYMKLEVKSKNKLKMSIQLVNRKLKEKGITHEALADKLEISRPTMYKRFISGKWKKHQKITLKKLGLI